MSLNYTVQVLADLSGAPYPGATPATDITSYVRTVDTPIGITFGRDDEDSDVTASICTFILDNDTRPGDAAGRFTPLLSGLVHNLFTPEQAAPGCVSGTAAAFTPGVGCTVAIDKTTQVPGNGNAIANPCTVKATTPAGTTPTAVTTQGAPVVVGNTYAAAVQINNTAGTVAVRATLWFLNAAGGGISGFTGTNVAAGTIGYSLVSAAAPALSVTAALFVGVAAAPAGGFTFYAGNFDIEAAAAVTFEQVQPFYPHILPAVRIQVNVILAAITNHRFDGYIDSWTPNYDGGFATVAISATDILARMGDGQPLRGFITEEMILDAPAFLYPLQEPEGSTTFADLLNVMPPASVFNSKYGAGIVTAGQDPNGNFIAGTVAQITNAAYPGTGGFATPGSGIQFTVPTMPTSSSFDAWVETPTVVPITEAIILNARGQGGTLAFAVFAGGNFDLSITDANGVNADVGWTKLGLLDGGMHHFAWTIAADNKTLTVYADGVSVGTGVAASALRADLFTGMVMQLGLQATPSSVGAPISAGYAFIGGYPSALSAARVLAHYNAGANGFIGERTDLRIGRLLTYRPDLGQNVDVGVGFMGAQDIDGISLQQALLDVGKVEAGLVFADGQGRITMFSRSRLFNPNVYLTLDASLEQITPDVTFRLDDQDLLNDFTLSRPGGADQRYTDATSQALYGIYAGNDTIAVDTDLNALGLATNRVLNNKDAKVRSPNVDVDLLTETDVTAAKAVLALVPLERLAITNLPASAPATDGIVEGWSDSIALGAIDITFFTTPVPIGVFAWDGDSAHGWDHSYWAP